MKKFCILATQRSGSTWILDSIQHSVHSRSVFGELFLDQPARTKDPWREPQGNLEPPVRYYDWRKASKVFPLTAPRLYLSFLELLYARKESYFGFKVMCNQLLQKPWLAGILKRDGYAVLHLKRNNLLDVYVSIQNQHKTKPHLRRDDPDRSKDYEAIRLEPPIVYRHITGMIRRENTAGLIMRFFGISMETVEYSRLAKGDNVEIEKLNRFIGRPVDLFSQQGLQKLSRKDTSQKIINYQEVISYLSDKKLPQSYYLSPY
jgi:LPS sulfotransferase NodH